MKTLVLCRHAKSSWKFPVDDIYRPLNSRGVLQAPEMAKSCNTVPDKVLCSPAVRAWATAVSYFTELGWDYHKLQICPDLYEVDAGDIVALLKKQNDTIATLFIFGHNPGFNDVLDILAVKTAPHENIVTSARVTVALRINSWSELVPGCGEIKEWLTPNKDND